MPRQYHTKGAYEEALRKFMSTLRGKAGVRNAAVAKWHEQNKPPKDDRAYTPNSAHNSHTLTGVSHHLHQGDLK